MKGIELTTWERQTCVEVMSQHRGDAGVMRIIHKLLDVLVLSEEERKLVGWTEEPAIILCPDCKATITLDRDSAARWSDTERVFVLEFEDAYFELLATTVTGYNQWMGGSARFVVPLVDKIESVE